MADPAVITDRAPIGASARLTIDEIVRLGFTHVIAIPDSESRLLCEAAAAHERLSYLTPCREGEGIAIAAGLWVGGAKPLLVIQNTGLMEAGDALRGCGIGPRVPLQMLIGWRGYAGASQGTQPVDSAYPYTEPILDAWQIPYEHLMSNDDIGVIASMDERANRTSKPAAVITGWKFQP